MEWLERDESIKRHFEFTNQWVILPVFVFDLDPEVARDINHVLRVMEEKLLIEIWELCVLYTDRELFAAFIW